MSVPRVSFVVLALAIVAAVGLPTKGRRNAHGLPIPPISPRHAVLDKDYNARLIGELIASWTPEDKQNVWEWSGLFEGDIMLDPNEESMARNGLINKRKHWPGGIVPIYIDDDDFNADEIKTIEKGIEEYHQRTCLRFRPYNETDKDYVVVKGERTGCWSFVGRMGKAQVVNLQKPGCMGHGIIVHELLHALGFYHQQSASNRDEYVKIHWRNIEAGREHNFKKYDKKTVTDYNIGYDYGSVMHYSNYAFSYNDKPTITPLQEGAKIGQRLKLSEKDVAKLQAMYKEECGDRKPGGYKTVEGSPVDFMATRWSRI